LIPTSFEHLPTWTLKIKVRIGHIELLDAEDQNFLFHFPGSTGLEFQVDVALIQSGALVDKAEVNVIQLKAVHFIGVYCDFAAQDIVIKLTNPVPF
jgi:hypothetical protein